MATRIIQRLFNSILLFRTKLIRQNRPFLNKAVIEFEITEIVSGVLSGNVEPFGVRLSLNAQLT